MDIIVPYQTEFECENEIDTPKSRIFISYAWEDKKLAHRLRTALLSARFDVWVDDSEVHSGDNISQRVNEALEWCEVLLLLWSESAKRSFWVDQEWSCAMNLNKKIIPCLIDNAELPPLLSNTAHVKFDDFDGGFQQLTQDLRTQKTINLWKGSPDRGVDGRRHDIELRSRPKFLSEYDVQQWLRENNYFDGIRDIHGKGFDRELILTRQNRHRFVIEMGAGLQWQQSGTKKETDFEGAKLQITQYNSLQIGGYNNWRLPTLEEAMSLMHSTPKKGRYISPLFARRQVWLWTSDNASNSRAWVVAFDRGYCLTNHVLSRSFVRAVRTMSAGERLIMDS